MLGITQAASSKAYTDTIVKWNAFTLPCLVHACAHTYTFIQVSHMKVDFKFKQNTLTWFTYAVLMVIWFKRCSYIICLCVSEFKFLCGHSICQITGLSTSPAIKDWPLWRRHLKSVAIFPSEINSGSDFLYLEHFQWYFSNWNRMWLFIWKVLLHCSLK